MKLILDEWIVREVIDTLYMARTTLLGITGLDSPQEVAEKSANETAITRRISKAIDIIQQSKKPPIPEGLEEASEAYRRKSFNKVIRPNIDGPMPEYGGSIKDAFIAGAKWQAEQDQETIELAEDHAYLAGAVNEREKMMKERRWKPSEEQMSCLWQASIYYKSGKIKITGKTLETLWDDLQKLM